MAARQCALLRWQVMSPTILLQVAKVCEDISNNPELQNGYNAVGFSQGEPMCRVLTSARSKHATAQAAHPFVFRLEGLVMNAGGQFMRAVVERCQGGEHGGARMHTLVTMGAQHQVRSTGGIAGRRKRGKHKPFHPAKWQWLGDCWHAH